MFLLDKATLTNRFSVIALDKKQSEAWRMMAINTALLKEKIFALKFNETERGEKFH